MHTFRALQNLFGLLSAPRLPALLGVKTGALSDVPCDSSILSKTKSICHCEA